MSITLKKLICCLLFIFYSVPVAPQGDHPLVLVHYMSWYASEEISGQWGWHWTMNHFAPPESAATQNSPVVGYYDSSDPHLLEYHVSLMKLSGIDGVIIDWYGTNEFRDYGMIHKNMIKLVKVLEKANLKYAICYEDQAVKHFAEENELTREQSIIEAQQDLQWLDQYLFSREGYVRLDGRPILPVFGPQFFNATEWHELKSSLSPSPIFYSLPHLKETSGLEGIFGWPPVHGGKEITETEWSNYLDSLYSHTADSPTIAVAFPGFHDIYEQAGLHESYGYIDPQSGSTFERTWNRAIESNTPIIQIATWNDFGEDTSIEPTKKHGFRYLKQIHQTAKPGEEFNTMHMELPLRIYLHRKAETATATKQEAMNKASGLLLGGKAAEAFNTFQESALGESNSLTAN